MSTPNSKKSMMKRVRGALGLGKKDKSPVPRAGADSPAGNYPITVTGFENTEGQSQNPLGQYDGNSTADLGISSGLDISSKSPHTVSASGDTEREDQHATAQQIKLLPNMSNNNLSGSRIYTAGRDVDRGCQS
ncbi:hypothetical protein K435DRAFT_801051 [Dendrothele bispora CBS 962.96]|uniref:Uncharacterized protein n=1 Tax=Dendrothele bispora (strain CBS 962.96) TaxID=1314807 RepID=A0A4S8LQS2_DENBC|nr:hypothetical protein K435DRAFT_801051 [Dendrothele bispora CBS 962.96]